MGALQPGLPNPAMIPENWCLLIVDLKDCFFTIALHENDKQAREAHSTFHQNAKGLARAYKLSMEQARAIVKACPICSYHNSGIG
ncbi:POK18 protein, partial [Corythaixoides concolor]|nr:POK18 protein [Corythaixoides concolor]